MQVDERTSRQPLGRYALGTMEVVVKRSKSMTASVAEDRQPNGGLPALKREVLQFSNAERGCNPTRLSLNW